MMNSLTADEFNDWMEYEKLEPTHGMTMEIAHLAMMVASFMGQKDVHFDDFYINKDPKPQIPTPEEEQNTTEQDNSYIDNFVRNAYH